MIDNIIDSLKTQIGEAVQGSLPEGLNGNDVASAAGDSLMEQFQQSAGNGDFSGIMEMFSGSETAADSPVLSNISPTLISGISGKLGIDPSVAQGLVDKFLPVVMNMFNKQAGAEGGFDIGNIISQFTGGSGGNITDIISQFTGNKGNAGGGGIFDKLKGLFG